jgi:exodeoxyribonuclease-5
MTVVLSPTQDKALQDIRAWFDAISNGGPREFFMFGFAGTGKSTLAAKLPEALNLPMYTGPAIEGDTEPGILYVAYTGKAASVLRRKELFAYTIHQAIYGRAIVNEPAIDKVLGEMASLEADGTAEAGLMRQLNRKLKKLQQPNFSTGLGKHISNAALVVVDECSMIDDQLYSDLAMWGKPILFMGDPAQLPPVGGTSQLITVTPNVMLTEIHRQALENPIIRMSQHLRESSMLPRVVTDACTITRDYPDVADMAAYDQIITGHHNSRRVLNRYLSKHHAFDDFPAGKGEKLINLKNDHKLGIMNGEMVTVKNVDHNPVERYMVAKVFAEINNRQLGNDELEQMMIYDGYFRDTVQYVDGRVGREYQQRKELMELDWGYAITGHKSQGSEWDSVFVWDSKFGRTEIERRQWLYTALTRARERVKIYSPLAI